MYSYQLGFRVLANLLGRSVTGEPLEAEHYAANGDSQQQTERGLMAWRKADNWTAFTDGYRTWINGPQGVQSRLNTERFPWESPPEYYPTLYSNPSPSIAGVIAFTPHGCILHGSRSGISGRSRFLEFHGTRAYAMDPRHGLGWQVTIGDDAIATHMDPRHWGWNCRSWSSRWLAVEFAQPTAAYPITDEQVRAFVWWWRNVVQESWPRIELNLLTHAETDPGKADGKSDVFPLSDRRADELRHRILSLF